MTATPMWTLAQWRAAYRDEGLTPQALLYPLLSSLSMDDPAWLYLIDESRLAARLAHLDAQRAAVRSLDDLPLYGVPFAIKDNIDAAGMPTTCACPAFSYMPEHSATVVQRLEAAGAVLIGKTNLDQFATGLVGTRSPRGAVPNTFEPSYVSGGSSSGSASVVARGLVPFSLGTDTAGSGRVPAGFNNIVGLKPSRGWLSTVGLVPACRTLDCISVFALTVDDAEMIADLAGDYDAADPYSRRNPGTAPVGVAPNPQLAVPDRLEFFGDTNNQAVFDKALARLRQMGAKVIPIDFSPFTELAELLYYGPWVAERTLAVEGVDPQDIDPVVRGIVQTGHSYSACDAFRAEYRRAQLSRDINDLLAGFDALVVPTSPTIRTLAEMAIEPVSYNSQFGTYTNFTNLADLCALAVPAGFRDDGLPAGITFIAPVWHDKALAALGRRWQTLLKLPLGTSRQPPRPVTVTTGLQPANCVRVAVVGAHLTGMPLNFQLTTRDAVLVEETTTSPEYRLFALPDSVPPKPGLVRTNAGAHIVVELWDVPTARFGEFVAEVPPPLGIGNLKLADGRWVKGFICEPWALESALDITEFGGWRAYIASRS